MGKCGLPLEKYSRKETGENYMARRPRVEDFNPFGEALHEIITKRGLGQRDLARMIIAEGYEKSAPQNISNAMRINKAISNELYYCIRDALRRYAPWPLAAEEEGRLEDASKRTATEDWKQGRENRLSDEGHNHNGKG